MKRLISLFLIILVAVTIVSAEEIAIERACHLCDKIIWVNEDFDYGLYFNSVCMYSVYLRDEGEKVEIPGKGLIICKDCYTKFGFDNNKISSRWAVMKKQMDDTFLRFISKAREENKELIAKHGKKWKEKKIAELRSKLKAIEKELKEEKDKNNYYYQTPQWYYNNQVDKAEDITDENIKEESKEGE